MGKDKDTLISEITLLANELSIESLKMIQRVMTRSIKRQEPPTQTNSLTSNFNSDACYAFQKLREEPRLQNFSCQVVCEIAETGSLICKRSPEKNCAGLEN